MKKILYISLIAILVLIIVIVSCQMSVTTPEVPALKLPADGTEDVSLTPSFYWGLKEEKKEDILYSLKIYSLSNGGTETVFQKTGLSENEFKLTTELKPSTQYTWAVSYLTQKDERVTSSSSKFTTLELPELKLKIPSNKVYEGKVLNIDLKSFLSGLNGREVNFCLLDGPGKISDSVYTFNPGFEDSGSYIIDICAKDRFRETSQKFEIIVLDSYRPMAVKNIQEDYAINEGELFKINLIEKIDNPEANLLTYKIIEGPGEIKDGVYTFKPDFDQQGKEFVKIIVEDPATEIDFNFHIVISDVNQIPILSIIPIQNTKENATLTINLADYIHDPDNDRLKFEKIQGPGNLKEDGLYTFLPGYEDAGDYSVTFSFNDGKEASSDKFTILVENTNRVPVESRKIENQQVVLENESLQINLKECFADPDGDEIEFSLIDGPGKIEEGIFTYSPDFDSDSTTSVSIKISDGQDSLIKAYDLTIKDVNRAPAIDVSQPINSREEFVLIWTATDSDDDDLLFDVYFSDQNTPSLVAKDLTIQRWSPSDSNMEIEPFKTYYWQIVAKDSKGLQTRTAVNTVEFINKAPEKPLAVKTAASEKVVALPFTVSWISQDLDDGQNLTYDFYLGTDSEALPLLEENITAESYTLNGLESGQKYYWKVVAKDPFDGANESEIYSFTTNQPPLGPTNPGIENGALDVSSTDTAISWSIPENPDNDLLSYDVYLGTESSNLKLIASGIPENACKLTELTGSQKYFWQIVTKDEHGEETAGPIWSFTTDFGPGSTEWVFKAKYDIRSSPAISDDGIIYFGADDDYLYAIDREGNFIWKFDCGNVVLPSPSIGADGTIYIATGNKYVYAVGSDGRELWKKKLEGACYSSPAVDKNGVVYIGDSTAAVHAISSEGKELWKFMATDEVRSSPAVGYSGTVYFGSDDGYIYAVNSDGTLKWQYKTDGFVRSSPALDEDENVYIGSFDGNMYALNKNGALLWKTGFDAELRGSPSIYHDGTIYVGAFDGTLNALNADGSLRWSHQIDEGPFWASSPAIGADGTVYIGTWEKTVLAIGADGKRKWTFEAGDYIKSSPVIDIDGSLYIGTYGARLYSIATESMGISENSPWPMFRKDQKHTATQ